jgi:hypothetical protein
MPFLQKKKKNIKYILTNFLSVQTLFRGQKRGKNSPSDRKGEIECLRNRIRQKRKCGSKTQFEFKNFEFGHRTPWSADRYSKEVAHILRRRMGRTATISHSGFNLMNNYLNKLLWKKFTISAIRLTLIFNI